LKWYHPTTLPVAMGCYSSRAPLANITPHVVQPPPVVPQGDVWTVIVEKHEAIVLGIGVMLTSGGLQIVSIYNTGALGIWNQKNPSLEVRPGDKIVSVNGQMEDSWQMVDKMWQDGILRLQIMRTSSHEVEVTESRSFLAGEPEAKKDWKSPLDGLPYVTVQEAGATECTICFEEYTNPEARVLVLPCNHAFHPSCVAMWFQRGRRHCPLCNEYVEHCPVAEGFTCDAWDDTIEGTQMVYVESSEASASRRYFCEHVRTFVC